MKTTFHKTPEAMAYLRSFFIEWKDRLETDQGSKFLNEKGIGQLFSKSFLSLFLRYAHTHWPEKLSIDHYELAIRDEKFRAAHYKDIKQQLKHKTLIEKPTRLLLLALMKNSLSKGKTGRPNADGWHHLIAVATHNTSLKYKLTIGEEDYSNGKSAQAAVVMALSDLFPDSDVDYQQNIASLQGTIPGRELLNKTWEKWRHPLRPAGRKEKGFTELDLVETQNDVFYTFYLTHFTKQVDRLKI